MTYRNEGVIAGKFTRFQALELKSMIRSLLRETCASGPDQKINCITYGKLLTIKRLVSRFVSIWRFAGGRRRQSKSGRGMRILILDDAGQDSAVIEDAVRQG